MGLAYVNSKGYRYSDTSEESDFVEGNSKFTKGVGVGIKYLNLISDLDFIFLSGINHFNYMIKLNIGFTFCLIK